MAVGLSARRLAMGIGAGALVAGPGIILDAAPGAVAQPCGGELNLTILAEGTPVTCVDGLVPASGRGAPTQEILSLCSGIPGCLANTFYGPGTVHVPQRDTTVRQSQ